MVHRHYPSIQGSVCWYHKKCALEAEVPRGVIIIVIGAASIKLPIPKAYRHSAVVRCHTFNSYIDDGSMSIFSFLRFAFCRSLLFVVRHRIFVEGCRTKCRGRSASSPGLRSLLIYVLLLRTRHEQLSMV
mgnify:CR=1 FL=1